MVPPHELNPDWLAFRRRLHERFATTVGFVDPSRLAYLHGPERDFDLAEVVRLWERAARRDRSGVPPRNHVYVHVPFCKSICHFCNYERLRAAGPDLLERWLERVERTLRALAPALRRMVFHALYIGGGTPSVLPAPLLARLLDGLHAGLRFHPAAARHFELDPAVMNRERADVLVSRGVRRFSFGVQTLDAAVNLAHGRGPQDGALVARRFAELRAAGAEAVSCDFVLGLAGTTPEGIAAQIESVLREFRPEWVDVYYLTPTLEYVGRHFGGSYPAFWEHLRAFRSVPGRLAAVAGDASYRLVAGRSHHVVLQREGTRDARRRRPGPDFAYTQLAAHVGRPLNLLGLGSGARSQVFGLATMVCRDPGEDPTAPGPAWFAGHDQDLRDEARTYLVSHLRDRDELGRDAFARVLGRDLAEVVPEAVAAWQAEGIAHLLPDRLVMREQSRDDRTRSLLWLVPRRPLEREIARHLGVDLTAEGIARSLAPLAVGTVLPGGWTIETVGQGSIRVRSRDGTAVDLELGPPLGDGGGIRVNVAEGGTSSAAGLAGAAAAIRRALRGASGLGPP